MNWDNQDKDPWGGKNDAPDFDDLIKKFSAFIGGKDNSSGKGSGTGSGNGGGMKIPTIRIFLYGFFAFLIIYGSQCIYQLDASERAVILRFGKFYEEQQEGLNFRLAGIDERYIENVSLTRRYTQTNSMLTKDENIVDVTVSAQYRIANLKDFVLNVKDPEGSLREAIESALRHVVGDNTLEQTLTVGRENIAQEVQGRLQQILNNYATGLVVQQVNIEKTDPPAAVKDAFDDVVAAREDKEKLQNEAERYALTIVPEARGQAQARIRNAEGYLLEVVANAEGEVGRFTQLLEEYQKAPKVTRDRMYIDAMQSVLSNTTKVMIDVDNGNNLMLLPLDKMMQNSSRPSSLNDILNRKGDNNE
ncbi:FtsH protease activity modulator HflK [Gammaproteobacteria bacterium]|nr:FtsH protease activity modulator HflK [Gammaproteobacteria bacterium]MDA9133760.1 FtsH protease activity modulator HflK [Gammaproteobacteria bacterium]